MLVLQVLRLIMVLLVIPTVAGTLFAHGRWGSSEKIGDAEVKICRWMERPVFAWISGQMLLWAGFLVIAVPLILREKSFSTAVNLFGGYIALLLSAALAVGVWRLVKKPDKGIGTWFPRGARRASVRRKMGVCGFLWIIFWGILLLMLILTGIMAYEEGDDAYYIAISVITESSDSMYHSLPYTGLTTGLDARHGLAPFPVWVAWLARISGMHTATVAHIVLPMAVVLMTHGVYYLLAVRLFRTHRWNVPFFMILTQLLILFGGYSVYTAENFLLVRASQGKAVIANIVIPFLIWLLLLLMEQAEEKDMDKCGKYWVLISLTTAAGCLCSTLGTFLTCLLLGVAYLCILICYRRWRWVLPMMLTCVVPLGMALLYFGIR